MGSFWLTASGSGGVGKSSVALALSQIAARQGVRTLLLDAAGPYRTCDLYLGVQSLITVDLTDVLIERLALDVALYPIQGIPGLSYACASLFSCIRLDELSALLLTLQGLFDLIVVDFPTGEVTLSPSLLRDKDRIILLTRPDPFAVRSAEMLAGQYRNSPAPLYPLINFEDHALVKKHIQYSADTVGQILDCPVLGSIPRLQNFYTLRALEDKIAVPSGKEQRLFQRFYDALSV